MTQVRGGKHFLIEHKHKVSFADMGAAVQLMGIIRTLLDPENMLASVNKSEKTDFLNHFYKHCMHGEPDIIQQRDSWFIK